MLLGTLKYQVFSALPYFVQPLFFQLQALFVSLSLLICAPSLSLFLLLPIYFVLPLFPLTLSNPLNYFEKGKEILMHL